MVMHIKHSRSHKDATLRFLKKKEDTSKNYTINMNLEDSIQFSC